MSDEALQTEAPEISNPTNIDIPVDEPANDNAEVETQTGPTPTTPERPSRKERRQGMLREEQEARKAAETRLQQAIEEQGRMREALAELRGRQEAMHQQQLRANGDPVDRQIEALEAEAARHLDAASQAKDPTTARAMLAEYHKALRRAATLDARREAAVDMERFGRSLPNPETAGMKVTLGSEFPWLSTNASARNAADGYIGVLVAKGRPNNLATFREACAMAAKDFGLGGTPDRPSDARRSAYNGVSARQGSDDDGRLTLQVAAGDEDKLRKMATALRPDLDPEAAYDHWKKTVGPRMARK